MTDLRECPEFHTFANDRVGHRSPCVLMKHDPPHHHEDAQGRWWKVIRSDGREFRSSEAMGIRDQPAPKRTDGPAIWPLVIADMQARDAIGRERYGTPLQAFNGRDPLVDAYQELLDGAVYLRQAIEERTALPPDPAPTGERRPCGAWREVDGEKQLIAGSIVCAVTWYRPGGVDAKRYMWTCDDGRVDSGAYIDGDEEAAQLAAESAAAELLRAGLRALGVEK